MSEIIDQSIDVEELITRIREEVSRRRAMRGTPVTGTGTEDTKPLGLVNYNFQPPFELQDEGYHVNDFLRFHDRDFVINAYRGLLKREPDVAGLRHYLRRLREGKISKVEILGGLRFSSEGRGKKTRLKGILIRLTLAVLRRIPVLGYVFQLVGAIIRLPVVLNNIAQFENYAMALQTQRQDYINSLVRRVEEVGETHARQVTHLDGSKVNHADFQSQVKRLETLRADVDGLGAQFANLKGIETSVNELEKQLAAFKSSRILEKETEGKLAARKQDVSLGGQRLNLPLEEAHIYRHESINKSGGEPPADAYRHSLDAFYLALEDKFRGTREDIKKRVSVYLPILEETMAGSATGPLLDIGCGRGEWLELLKDNDIDARGVDSNRAMVEKCKGIGLDVEEADAIGYLKKLPSNSLGALTIFHVIEHLLFEEAVAFIDEALRVLEPGGVVIVETPNPNNVLVGSNTFYLDPTHRNPLPSSTLSFLVKMRGFSEVRVIELNAAPESLHVNTQNDDGLSKRFNALFYGPQDYAVIGRRW